MTETYDISSTVRPVVIHYTADLFYIYICACILQIPVHISVVNCFVKVRFNTSPTKLSYCTYLFPLRPRICKYRCLNAQFIHIKGAFRYARIRT